MYLDTPGRPNQLKKTVYLVASAVLGILLSFIAHAFIEIKYLRWMGDKGLVAPFYNGCALPPLVQITLLLSGAIGGFFLGRFWWRKIYIEKAWRKKHSRLKNK